MSRDFPSVGALTIRQSASDWQQRPAAPLLADGSAPRVVLTRWARSDAVSPLEVSADHADDSHFITYAMRATDVHFSIGDQAVTAGLVAPKRVLLQGPTSQRRRSVYHAAFDFFRVYFPQALLAEVLSASEGNPPSGDVALFGAHFIEDPVIDDLMRLLASAGDDDNAYGPLFIDGIGLALASRLVAGHARRHDPQPVAKAGALPKWRLRRVVDYVESRLAEPILLSELAGVAGLSRTHFAAQFRAATGQTPHAFLLQRRVETAKKLLGSELTIAAVAYATGFSSQAHLTTAFRKVVGDTPARWREALRGQS